MIVADIEAESRERKISLSDVIRDRLKAARKSRRTAGSGLIGDLVGSVHGLPPDLSSNRRAYLKTTGYGQKRSR
jgi:hypothetical protein